MTTNEPKGGRRESLENEFKLKSETPAARIYISALFLIAFGYLAMLSLWHDPGLTFAANLVFCLVKSVVYFTISFILAFIVSVLMIFIVNVKMRIIFLSASVLFFVLIISEKPLVEAFGPSPKDQAIKLQKMIEEEEKRSRTY